MEPMEQLWQKLASPDKTGEPVIVYNSIGDLVFLYANGFVDAVQYSLKEWLEAFADSRQKDGSYRLTRPQWLAKKKYRYDGVVEKPFDPWRIKEREYNEAEFAAILRDFIVPSTWLAKESIPQVIANYQSHGLFKDGKILVNKVIKEDFSKMLKLFPSPLRILQISVHGVPKGIKQWDSVQTAQKSGFTQAPDEGKEAAMKLSALFQNPIQQMPAQASDASTLTLKEMMKKKKRPPTGRV